MTFIWSKRKLGISEEELEDGSSSSVNILPRVEAASKPVAGDGDNEGDNAALGDSDVDADGDGGSVDSRKKGKQQRVGFRERKVCTRAVAVLLLDYG